MDDIRDEAESSLTERKPAKDPQAPDRPEAMERHKVGPESEVRGGPEAPEP